MRQQIRGVMVMVSDVTGKCEVWWQLTPLLRHSHYRHNIAAPTQDSGHSRDMYILHANFRQFVLNSTLKYTRLKGLDLIDPVGTTWTR